MHMTQLTYIQISECLTQNKSAGYSSCFPTLLRLLFWFSSENMQKFRKDFWKVLLPFYFYFRNYFRFCIRISMSILRYTFSRFVSFFYIMCLFAMLFISSPAKHICIYIYKLNVKIQFAKRFLAPLIALFSQLFLFGLSQQFEFG